MEEKGKKKSASILETVKNMMQKAVYYEDDYEITRDFRETADYPAFSLRFRPINIIQSARLTDDVLKTEGIVGAMQAHARLITKQVVDWNLVKSDGSAIDFKSIKEVERLNPTIFNRIVSTIKGDDRTPMEDIQAVQTTAKN